MGNTATGAIVGFITAIVLAFAVIYASIWFSLPLWGNGLIPTYFETDFMLGSIFVQMYMAMAEFLLQVYNTAGNSTYIIGSIVWIMSGLVAGMLTRDIVKGVSAGLVSAIIMALVCWIVKWVLIGGFAQGVPDITILLGQNLLDLLLMWVINGVLAGIIAAVGGAIGGTLTSQRETR
ncbi:MAG: hypothetical protein ACFFCO_08030 [Promethearchaeota archaeon]